MVLIWRGFQVRLLEQTNKQYISHSYMYLYVFRPYYRASFLLPILYKTHTTMKCCDEHSNNFTLTRCLLCHMLQFCKSSEWIQPFFGPYFKILHICYSNFRPTTHRTAYTQTILIQIWRHGYVKKHISFVIFLSTLWFFYW